MWVRFCHKQITESQVSGKTEGLLMMQDCEGDRSRCVTWVGNPIGGALTVCKSKFLFWRAWSWEFYLRRSRSWETQGNRTHTQEDRWRGFWETTVQVSSSNERKGESGIVQGSEPRTMSVREHVVFMDVLIRSAVRVIRIQVTVIR